jgi:hypothetical protein
MKKKTAEGILESVAWMGFPIEMLYKYAQGEASEKERDKIMEYLRPILSAQTELMLYVAHEHPELDPIGKGEENYYKYKLKYQTKEFPARRLSQNEKDEAEKAGIEAADEIKNEMSNE